MTEPNEEIKEGEGETPTQPPTDNVQDDGQPSGGEQRTLTWEEHQAKLNKLVPERGRQYVRSLLSDLGYQDQESLQEALAELKKYRESEMSEVERVQAAAREAAERAERAERERDEALIEAQDRMIRAAFLAEAGKLGAKHPSDAYSLADLTGVTLSDNGEVEGVAEAVKALIESGRLPTMGKPQAPDLNAGAGGGERPGEAPVRLTEEELEVAKKLRIKPEDYAKHKT